MERKGLPSSFLAEASGSVVTFSEFLSENCDLKSGRILDVGTGRGRNALYLAGLGFDVCAIDWIIEPLRPMASKVKAASATGSVFMVLASAGGAFPFRDSSFDAVIDTFCSIYLVDRDERLSYQSELARVLRPGGHYLMTGPSRADGFYGPLLPGPWKNGAVVDPYSGIVSIVLDETEVAESFSDRFQIRVASHKGGKRRMYDASFERSTLVFIMRRR